MLKHYQICMTADPNLYLPFRGDAPGSERGEHHLNYGFEDQGEEKNTAKVRAYVLNIFPQAKIVAIWETNITMRPIRRVWAEDQTTANDRAFSLELIHQINQDIWNHFDAHNLDGALIGQIAHESSEAVKKVLAEKLCIVFPAI